MTRATRLELQAPAAVRLRQAARSQGDGELRAYLPGVVCKLANAICRYENQARVLTPELVDRVLALYFTEDLGVERTGPAPHHTVDVPPFSPDPEIEAEMARLKGPGPDQDSDATGSPTIDAPLGAEPEAFDAPVDADGDDAPVPPPYPGMFTGSLDPAAATIAEGLLADGLQPR